MDKSLSPYVAYVPAEEEIMTFQDLITLQQNLAKFRDKYIVILDSSNYLFSLI